jgi:hypothetical protein
VKTSSYENFKGNAYLTFDGNRREAMKFQAQCTGAELSMTTFAEAPGNFPPEAKKRIMHARLTKNGAMIMASDQGCLCRWGITRGWPSSARAPRDGEIICGVQRKRQDCDASGGDLLGSEMWDADG